MPIKYNIPFLACVIFSMAAFFVPDFSWAQNGTLTGKVLAADQTPVAFANIHSQTALTGTTGDGNGQYTLSLPPGNHRLRISALGHKRVEQDVYINPGQSVYMDFVLPRDTTGMGAVEIVSLRVPVNQNHLRDVENFGIYAGKKSEVVLLGDVQGNTAANSARQIFAKVPGMHIQENDGGGVQMAVSTRGLNPSRMLEFNVRQNGYDIAADALGYPESYYTPPAFVMDRIQVVRGAASLQYGPQFGGLINFMLKKGGPKPIQGELQATYGSFNFIALNASVGGGKGKFNYYAYAGKRRGDGWRENTAFDITNGYAHVDCDVSAKVNLGLEYTGMLYTMRQPGGLTDAQYAENPRQSLRNRNWFTASWHVLANTIRWKMGDQTFLDVRNFMVLANRYSVGNLNAVTEADTGGYRNLQKDDYLNFGTEIRLMQYYKIRHTGQTFLAGVRVYRGNTHRMQGLGTDGAGADFSFIHPTQVEDSDFRFPSWNVAAFAENLFRVSSRFSVTPGIRAEFIQTASDGYYVESGTMRNETKTSARAFVLAGLGLSYKPYGNTEIYANFSQNYSAVNFNDIRVNNPNLRVDPNLHDVKGFNADLGYRGRLGNYLMFDVSAYYLYYKGRIGNITQYDENFELYQYRTNLSDSRNIGAEAYVELDLFAACKARRTGSLSLFVSAAYTDARYIKSPNKALEGKRVELAPEYIARGGIAYRYKSFATQLQYARTAAQFTDANNTVSSANGVTGIIPAYGVGDFSVSYEHKKVKLSAGCNNLFNAKYFTRRASGYPGPGILPSDPRNFYVTLGVKL